MKDTIEDKIKYWSENLEHLIKKIMEGSCRKEEIPRHCNDFIRSALLSQQKEFKEALGEMEEDDMSPDDFPELGNDHPYIRNELRKEVLTKLKEE